MTIWVLALPSRAAALSCFIEPPVDSFKGTATLKNGGIDIAGISAWSWLEEIEGKNYRYFAYRLSNEAPYNFSPYIAYLSVTNRSGIAAEMTGSATSSSGKEPWLGIPFSNNTDWIALSEGDVILFGETSDEGSQDKADKYYEYAVPGYDSAGLADVMVSGGGSFAYGQTYGPMPEADTFALFGFGAAALLLKFGRKNKKGRRIVDA